MAQKLNIPKKEIGDKFYAEEVNQIVGAINDNSTKIDNNAKEINDLKNQQFVNVDNLTAKRINVDENLYINKYLSNVAGDTFALKGNNIEGADYTLITDADLGDYVTKTDTKQIIKAQSLEVNNGGVKFYTTRDSLNSTVSNLIGDFDQDRMPYLDFQGSEGNPRLVNIGDPINDYDAATKNYVDQRAVTDWKYETTIEWDGTNTIKDYSYNLSKFANEVMIVGLTTHNNTNKGEINIYFSLSNQPATSYSRAIYYTNCSQGYQYTHIYKLVGEFYADAWWASQSIGKSNVLRCATNSSVMSNNNNLKIRSIKIKITTDLVRPNGAGQKWYIYSK